MISGIKSAKNALCTGEAMGINSATTMARKMVAEAAVLLDISHKLFGRKPQR